MTLRSTLKQRSLYPHQVDLIEAVLEMTPPARVVVADDAGLGTKRSIGGLLWSRRSLDRAVSAALVIAPAPLAEAWGKELQVFSLRTMRINSPRFRSLEAKTPDGGSPWQTALDELSDNGVLITSWEFMRRSAHIDALLAVNWDVVVFDQAHRAASDLSRNQALFLQFWNQSTTDLVLATSPGDPSRVLGIVHSSSFQPKLLRRARQEVLDWGGGNLFGSAKVEIVRLTPTSLERRLFEAVIAALDEKSQGESEFERFTRGALRRAAASSTLALDNALRRVLVEQEHIDLGDNMSPHPPAVPEDDELAEPVEDPGYVHTQEVVTGLADRVQRILPLLEQVDVDSKAEAFLALVASRQAHAKRIVAFCDYRETAMHLMNLAEEAGLKCQVVTGTSDPTTSDRSIEAFAEIGGLLVATVAGLRGLEIPPVETCIHYDLPSTQEAFSLRIARLQQQGAAPTQHVVFVDGVLVREHDARQIATTSPTAPSDQETTAEDES